MNDQQKPQKFELPNYTPPDWTIGELYNKSLHLVKNNKVLWIFGMASAGLTSGASNLRFDRLIDLIPKDQGQKEVELSHVLGTSTNIFEQLLSNIPTFIYILGGIELVILVLLGIIIGIITNAWANAALIEGIQTALGGSKPTIQDSSTKAFPSIKSLVLLNIIPILTLMGALLLSLFMLFWLSGGQFKTPFFVLGGIWAIALIILFILLTFANIWALRGIVIDKKPWKEALFAGIKLTRRKFWTMVLLGLVNLILGTIIFSVIFGIPLGLTIGGILSLEGNQTLGIGLLVLGGLLFVILLLVSILPIGIFAAFKTSVWTIAYNNIKEKYDK